MKVEFQIPESQIRNRTASLERPYDHTVGYRADWSGTTHKKHFKIALVEVKRGFSGKKISVR